MIYKVKLTSYAIRQMEETVAYISRELSAPDTSKRWLEKMKTEIASLSEMPERIPLTEEEPWHSYGVHKMVINHFLVYFWIDEESPAVWVTAVVYGRRDQGNALDRMPFDPV